MQPYFFPYIGYFQLINAVDEFILFDVVQYIERGWMNRNRILSLNLDNKWAYIKLPVKSHNRKEIISNIKINYSENWHQRIEGQLGYYKKIRAPFYSIALEIIRESLKENYGLLVDLNFETLKIICKYLDINVKLTKCSDLHFDFSRIETSGDWAFEITRQSNAITYINPVGGRELFDMKKFLANGIEVKFIKPNEIIYGQSKRDFVPWLSIIDVMMFNSPETINKMLDDFELV